MATIDVNKLKIGVAYLDKGGPYRVLKYDFHKMGRGKANIKVKAKNLLTGSIVNKSYLSGSKVERVDLEKKQLQYLYLDGGEAFFMDPKSFEQIEIKKQVLGDDVKFLVEGENAWVVFWDDKVLGVEVPASVEMKIAETEPWIKGNSATNVYKPATTQSGMVVQVPLFIKKGDMVKVNTSTGEYVNRVN